MDSTKSNVKVLETKLEKAKVGLEQAKKTSFLLHKLMAKSRTDKLYILGESLYNEVLQIMAEVWPEEDHREF